MSFTCITQGMCHLVSSDKDPDALLGRLSGPEWLAQGVAWRVSVNTVADSMRRQGLKGRKVKRNRGLTRQDKTAPKFPDLLKRDFTAATINTRWVGDITEIPTAEGKLYLATVIGSVFTPVTCRADLRAPQQGAGVRRDPNGRRGSRWRRQHRPGHLPHRPRFDRLNLVPTPPMTSPSCAPG